MSDTITDAPATMTETPEVDPPPSAAPPPLSPNLELWASYEEAFHYFNDKLFDSRLPPCILSFNARGRSWGYFKRGIWGEDANTALHEICLNPILLAREDDMIFQMLVRCMVHLWEHAEGIPPKQTRYCSVDFTQKMADLGLPCSETCGVGISHSVSPTGQYATVRPDVVSRFFPLKNQMRIEQPRKTRIRYDCPSCGFTAMASAGGVLFCHTEGCDTEMLKESDQEQDG